MINKLIIMRMKRITAEPLCNPGEAAMNEVWILDLPTNLDKIFLPLSNSDDRIAINADESTKRELVAT